MEDEGHFFVVTRARETAEVVRAFLCREGGDEALRGSVFVGG